ncbi:MAG: hypothetical protein PHP28_10000 [Actinomycetota bacterium]|nr:hypothetical protein [Actinomycetota bacterium]
MDAHDFVTFSLRREITFASPRPPQDVLDDFLATLLRGLREAGCAMVGHIKGMVESEAQKPLFFSLTSLDSAPRYRGGPLRPGSFSVLSMNIILAGVDKAAAAEICEDAAAGSFHAQS